MSTNYHKENSKPLGGFFELELPFGENSYHNDTIALSNGRTCFAAVLKDRKPSKVHIPFYCCNSLIQPLKELGIEFEFYGINKNFEPTVINTLHKDEMFLYINYFGIKSGFIKKLISHFKENLIIDNTQAFFEKKYGNTISFNSARKFFGVPDGGYLYGIKLNDVFPPNDNFIADHLFMRLDERQESAYKFFQENERIQNCDLKMVSHLSKKILASIDYGSIAQKRIRNFKLFAEAFNAVNNIHSELEDQIPFCYPFLPSATIQKEKLFDRNIFIPTLWKDVIERHNKDYVFENMVSLNLLPLPVDHRLSEEDVSRIIDEIKRLL